MKIRKAIKMARRGFKIARPTFDELAYFFVEDEQIMLSFNGDLEEGARFSVEDILANDWEVVE